MDTVDYTHSLDYQGITFKTAGRKTLTAKTFVAQTEAILQTHVARCAALVSPLYERARPQHKLCYEI
jgi:paired amphipathic helix protein Sin3a